ncbi:hypothetical protein K501DRAFT_257003 [Backusella circina FSU 941]|nr:hypothetical protein K501DRAFT_257003 [Backusella circina FSU 941]
MSEEAQLDTIDIEVDTLPQEEPQQSETPLFSSSDYNNEELVRLVELQRRHTELLNADIDGMNVLDEEDEDDDDSTEFSVHAKPKGPPVPDMRFEKQFEKAVLDLKEKGTSRIGIIWSAVIKDQIIVPFISGFAWSMCSTAWKWYRIRGKVVTTNKDKSSSGFLRGLKYGFANWSRNVYNAVLRNTGALRPALGA